tara:strand:- start:12970 stop:13395 length:426 start_codon:yes stop_codon:yes gene_type:complete
MKTKLTFTLLGMLAFSGVVHAEINYIDLETISNKILCESEGMCENTLLSADSSAAKAFTVDGVVLPPDALRDAEQQRGMIAASLYIKDNGDVASLPSPDEIKMIALQSEQAATERSKVLPAKLFPAPEITPRVKQIVISVK